MPVTTLTVASGVAQPVVTEHQTSLDQPEGEKGRAAGEDAEKPAHLDVVEKLELLATQDLDVEHEGYAADDHEGDRRPLDRRAGKMADRSVARSK
ncbi:MAG: hypothetical protein R3D25_05545 [Geminicoccaceae bacterium]